MKLTFTFLYSTLSCSILMSMLWLLRVNTQATFTFAFVALTAGLEFSCTCNYPVSYCSLSNITTGSCSGFLLMVGSVKGRCCAQVQRQGDLPTLPTTVVRWSSVVGDTSDRSRSRRLLSLEITATLKPASTTFQFGLVLNIQLEVTGQETTQTDSDVRRVVLHSLKITTAQSH